MMMNDSESVREYLLCNLMTFFGYEVFVDLIKCRFACSIILVRSRLQP